MSKVWNEKENAYTWTTQTEVVEKVVKRVVEELPNDKWTKTKLVEWCGANGVETINSGDTKTDILDKIADALEE